MTNANDISVNMQLCSYCLCYSGELCSEE